MKRVANAESYLEIGVFKGEVFEALRFSAKTGVDPKFRFDTSKHKQEGITFAETTSDVFFSLQPESSKYDVVFLDGLHHYDQTYRDLCNTLKHSHGRTMVLIDDTFPSDEYSVARDPVLARRSRLEATGVSGGWTGDVYKSLILIKHFHPYLEYSTIIGSGHPQTILWQTKTSNHSDLPFKSYDDKEELQRLIDNLSVADYKWLISDEKQILQTSTEEELFSYLEKIF